MRRKTWIVVADPERADIYSSGAHLRNWEKVYGLEPETAEPGSNLAQRHLARDIAERLHRGRTRRPRAYQEVVLVMPDAMVDQLHDELDEPTRTLVKRVIREDIRERLSA